MHEYLCEGSFLQISGSYHFLIFNLKNFFDDAFRKVISRWLHTRALVIVYFDDANVRLFVICRIVEPGNGNGRPLEACKRGHCCWRTSDGERAAKR